MESTPATPTIEESRFVSVRTRYGSQNHKALRSDPLITLCGHIVEVTRVGGSWAPEHPRAWDHADECGRCEKAAGTGGS